MWKNNKNLFNKNLFNKITKENMLVVFLCGILLFVILLPTGSSSGGYTYKSDKKSNDEEKENTFTERTQEGTDISEYKKELEKELEEFLTGVSGVGEVKVLIYMKNSKEYIVEKDSPIESSKNGESIDEARDEATVYTKNDKGYDVPFVTQTRSPSVDGVVIAAKGAANEAVRLQIVRLVMALYGVEANKVEVLTLK